MSEEDKLWNVKKAVRNLRDAITLASADEGKPQALVEALVKRLHRAQAKLAELTGSTEP